MEYLELFIEFVKAIAWPSSLLFIAFLLRPLIVQFIENFKDVENLELEIGGQKIKIDRLNKSVQKSIKDGIELSKNESPEKIENYIKEQASLLEELSELSEEEYSVLEFIGDNPGTNTKGNIVALKGTYASSKAEYRKIRRVLSFLLARGLVKRSTNQAAHEYTITIKGEKLLEISKTENV